ncbi:MAG: neutral zinc metallopeptidase [Chamaesiphon sp.]|nr:neutral zinc metallopeptidase [Chamaesiphon sp.]
MKLGKFLTRVSIAIITLIGTTQPLRSTELGPEVVLNATYQGLRKVDITRANPKVRWNVRNGTSSPCGRITGSLYCPRSNTIYITQQHIKMAYQYGDAALAYILAHEYAHAAQIAGGSRLRNITQIELQADCLAGYYMGAMPDVSFDDKDIEEIARIAYQVGDYEINNSQHHGTPKQRALAVLTGFQGSQQENGMAACQIR